MVELKLDETITKVNDNIMLIQKKHGLTFGTDALLLAAFIRKKSGAKAADFGSGSGIISLLCASRKKASHIYAVEIQKEYADIISRNAIQNKVENIVEAVNCDLREFDKEVDIVFTNPPYMKNNTGKHNEKEHKNIARHEIFGDVDDFCSSAARVLKYGGAFYAVYRPDRTVDLLCAMRKSGIEPKRMVTVYPDKNHEPCLILVEGKRGGRPAIFLPKPLIMYEDGRETEELKYIYDKGDFSEQYKKP